MNRKTLSRFLGIFPLVINTYFWIKTLSPLVAIFLIKKTESISFIGSKYTYLLIIHLLFINAWSIIFYTKLIFKNKEQKKLIKFLSFLFLSGLGQFIYWIRKIK
ncbi:hypothetical protein BUL40_06825 [Croceivirga radicis]|uniref:Uncharacterized protein n=1 Tax=Croceivirga radicis TaxID=1929488 RepID=A0A1V6LTP1_9FLAO|nr:hypothetical protein BUL40_06825 [Croceivirga radicis]